ncbi:C2 domain-containing protein 2-like isoform X4 [Mytilus edulis]|uniref:C2 domain-containing protein 2-like isoform X4 n=1 Tax=Mytilus edulis TaxID=6550 RepID=UPI0039F138D4
MVDITAKLIWYRLGETFDKMAEGGNRVTSWLFSDWDDNLLDVLLFGWIGWAVLVVLVVNAVLTFFGPLQPRVARWEKKEGVSGAPVQVETGAESTRWLNSGLNWFYLHYDSVPEFIELWVKSLNEQVVKLGGPVQLKFERVKPGSLPPKFNEITFEAGSDNKYLFHSKVDAKDLSFAIFASQQTSGGVKLTNLTANILKLKGTICFKCSKVGSDMILNISFIGRPDVKVQGKPVNPYQDPSDLVDIEVVEEVVRNAICLANTDINITKWLTGSTQNLPRPDTSSQPSSPRHAAEPVFESMEAKEQHSAFHAPPQQRVQRSMSGDKRLLVKIIKASGLGSKAQVDPTCLVYLDTPAQTYSTNECRGTANPFWDEQFLFDVNQNSSQLKFEVLDRRKPTTENFLGEAVVYYDELKRNPSSRQIISLQGRPERGNDIVSGSITVEFLVLDPLEAEAYNYSTPKNQISPKRTIEVTQAKSPSGMLVTKTTTTTQKHNNRHEPGLNSSPNYVEKRQNFDYDISGSSSLDRTSPDNMLPQDRSLSQSSEFVQIDGVDSVVETAIRELKSNKRKSRTPTKTTTLIITGVQRTPEQLDDDCIPTVITQPPSPGHHDRPDDMELGRQENPGTPNLKKSRSLGGSLKKLFRRSRKRSQGREDQEMSRESSLSRSSARNISKGPSRETSLTRTGQSSRESAIS